MCSGQTTIWFFQFGDKDTEKGVGNIYNWSIRIGMRKLAIMSPFIISQRENITICNSCFRVRHTQSLIQQILTEHLLCVRLCSRCWIHGRTRQRRPFCSHAVYIRVVEINQLINRTISKSDNQIEQWEITGEKGQDSFTLDGQERPLTRGDLWNDA